MATTNEYIEYVCEQIKDIGEVRYKGSLSIVGVVYFETKLTLIFL